MDQAHVTHSILAGDVDVAVRMALRAILETGKHRDSRAGNVMELTAPTTVLWPNGAAFISMDPVRDANPFFALAESIWMLEGRNDLPFLLHFNTTFSQFSDDGKEVRGSAYGKRWRSWFRGPDGESIDQIPKLINELADNVLTRRAVLQMWDAQDLNLDSKDVPCNTQVFFLVRDGRLDMTVNNRSNDAIYGLFGSNVVHFHVLHAYITMLLRAEMARRNDPRIIPRGDYYQQTNNLHAYTDNVVFQRLAPVMRNAPTLPALRHGGLPSMYENAKFFQEDCEYFCRNYSNIRGDPWARSAFGIEVLEPMIVAWNLHRVQKNTQAAFDHLAPYSSGWAQAGTAWLQRRLESKAAKEAESLLRAETPKKQKTKKTLKDLMPGKNK